MFQPREFQPVRCACTCWITPHACWKWSWQRRLTQMKRKEKLCSWTAILYSVVKADLTIWPLGRPIATSTNRSCIYTLDHGFLPEASNQSLYLDCTAFTSQIIPSPSSCKLSNPHTLYSSHTLLLFFTLSTPYTAYGLTMTSGVVFRYMSPQIPLHWLWAQACP